MKKVFPFLFAIVLFSFIISCEKENSEKNNSTSKVENTNPECKLDSDALRSADYSSSESGITYELDGSILKMTHINTVFNCCIQKIEASIEVADNEIIITESEELEAGGCDCSCLYDFEFEVTNIDQQIYTVKVIEPYLSDNDPKLEFTINFESGKSGSYIVTRQGYPYGL